MKRHWLLPLFLLMLIGCWDSADIDQRSLVLGVAIDPTENHQVQMSIELPILGTSLGGSETSSSEGSRVLSTTGTTVAEMATLLENRLWRAIFFGHTKVVVINEEVARDGIWPYIDFFDRNPNTSRRIKFIIANGEAADVFAIDNPLEPLASLYLSQLIEMPGPNAAAITLNFQDMARLLELTGDAALPRVRATDTELVVGGAALIKDYKFIAWLGENEARATQMLYNAVRSERITVSIDERIYVYTVRQIDTKIKARLVDGKIEFDIALSSDGHLMEVFSQTPKHTVTTPLGEIEQELNNLICTQIEHTIDKFQSYECDPIGFAIYVKRYYPKIWHEQSDDWGHYFSTTKFNISSDFKIRQSGVIE